MMPASAKRRWFKSGLRQRATVQNDLIADTRNEFAGPALGEGLASSGEVFGRPVKMHNADVAGS